MAKVNLLTIHYGQNKGSFLQTWATKKILESMNHQVTVIHLIDPVYDFSRQIKNLRGFLQILHYREFEKLRQDQLHPITDQMISIDPALIPEADYTVTGSDQTWNPEITKHNVMAYFQDFVPESCQRVTLSACFGFKDWKYPEDLTQKIRTELHKFKSISVRDHYSANICKDVFGVDTTVISDPTIAWGKYEELSGEIPEYPEIFGFLLYDTPLFFQLQPLLKADLGLPLRINTKTIYTKKIFNHPAKECLAHSLFGTIGVRDFLKRIAGSRFVVTSSFHGTVFCLLYNKPFITIPCGQHLDRFQRTIQLLQSVGLEDRIVYSVDDYKAKREKLLEPIDFAPINSFFERARREFINFAASNIV